MNQILVAEIEHFFVSYNEAKGKEFKLLGRFAAQKARKIVEESVKLNSESHKSERKT